MEKIRILESPRDGIQGLEKFIPTDVKIDYLNSLLKVGFDIIDFGSFVSPKAIPQLRDTEEVTDKLDLSASKSKLLVIIANLKGAEIACQYEKIGYLGFPYSTSETFLKRNINRTGEEAYKMVDELLNLTILKKKHLSVYLSMTFGNPYNDESNIDMVLACTDRLIQMGVKNISYSDIIGVARTEDIENLFSNISSSYQGISFGLHLHTLSHNWYEKVDAAWKSGCRWFDGVMKGFGGCPMTGYELLGNLDTNLLVSYFDKNNIPVDIDRDALVEANEKASLFYSSGSW